MMELINCVAIRDKIVERMKEEVATLPTAPTLAIIQVEGDKSSDVYVRNKEKLCEEVGINSIVMKLSNDTSQELLEHYVKELSGDKDIHGVMIQLPLPKHLNAQKAIDLIPAYKDVDGLTTTSQGLVFTNQLNEALIPCTPQGVMEIFKEMGYDLTGKNAVVVGRSQLFGNVMAQLLMRKNATVTLCHSYTSDLKEITKRADVVVSAIGQPLFLNEAFFEDCDMAIDVGISVVESSVGRKLYGDIDINRLGENVKYATPTPRGTGVLTVAMLLKNTIKAYHLQNKE